MKSFKINAKLISDLVMGVIMIPFLLIFVFIFSIGMIFHFWSWYIKKKL
jgi:hypothetical protein